MVSMPGLGDPAACDRAAADCDRAAQQLDAPIQRLQSLGGTLARAWRGTAGDSLGQLIDDRIRSLRQAQGELRGAASSLRAAASQIRDAIRRAQEAQRRRQQQLRQPTTTVYTA